jgi:chemotaxis protein methyltransferase CheR
MSSYASQAKSAIITNEDFLKFKEFFYRRTGISFEPSKRYFVDKRLVERIEATGTGTFRGYFTLLRFQASGEELQHLTNIMTVNETYFLREEYQFKCLVDSILPEIVKRRIGAAPIRIWCIPSSSGEEPYSVAMYLLEKWPGIKRVGCGDYLLRHRYQHPAPRARRPLLGPLRTACAGTVAEKVFQERGRRVSALRRSARGSRVHPRQSLRACRNTQLSQLRCDLLPQSADLFRRCIAQDSGRYLLRSAESGRVSLPGPLGIHEPHLIFVEVRKFPEAIVYRKSLEAK